MVLICFWLILPPPLLCRLLRGSVCEVPSTAVHRRQQTVPLPRTRRHQLTGCAGWIRLHAGLLSSILCIFFFFLIKLAMSSSSFHSSAPPHHLPPALHSLPFVHLIRVSSLNQISRNGFLRAHLFPHWPVVCFDYVLSRSRQGSLSLFAWQHAWQMRVSELWMETGWASLLSFTLTLTPIRRKQPGSSLEI